ncbi:MAG: exodeoxyribonuclease V subunit alpha [Simkaniaceae bacterium]
MQGFAEKALIKENPKLSENFLQPYAYIEPLLEQEIFTPFDFAFAKALLKNIKTEESVYIFLMALTAFSRGGHLCMKINDLEKLSINEEIRQKIKEGSCKIPSEIIHEVQDLKEKFIKPIVKWKEHFYLHQNYYFETQIIKSLDRLIQEKPFPIINRDLAKEYLAREALTERQCKAILHSLNHSVSIISGGPGRGKTYVAARFVQLLHQMAAKENSKILLAAPTGKAAMRLKESLQILKEDKKFNITIGTLHSLLDIKRENDFLSKEFFLDADLIVLDEASMIDVKLFSVLLTAVQKGSRLLIMGDENQLPPVEAGSIFSEICHYAKAAEGIAYSYLTECLRTDRKEIIQLSEDILAGNLAKIPILSIQEKDPADLLFQDFWEYAETFAFSLEDPILLFHELGRYQILSCLRKGLYGAANLNKKIYERLVAEKKKSEKIHLPIMISKNDYSLDLANGQIGILVQHLGNSLKENDYALFQTMRGTQKIPRVLLPSFELAFAASVHKSQGSEYDKVFLIMPGGSEIFGREVIYTAATRAKKEVKICTSLEVLEQCLQKSSRKSSALKSRLEWFRKKRL